MVLVNKFAMSDTKDTKEFLQKHWGYTEKNGPGKWEQGWEVAAGSRQSPIDIPTACAKYDSELGGLTVNYAAEDGLELVNTGHSIQGVIYKPSVLTGGPLKDRLYRLAQFHLHWGSEKGRGSEHTINGEMYDAELHLVHFNTKYASAAEALPEKDGLAVLGIMIKEGKPYEGFKAVSDNIKNVAEKGSPKFQVNGQFNPESLLPDNLEEYWTYLGSLTTPPLYESVTWLVLKTPMNMSKEQLDSLRSMIDADGDNMQNNYRPPCDLKERDVFKSFT